MDSIIENKGARRVSPQFIPKMIANIAGGHLSIRWGFKGPNQTITSACASGTDAIGIAMRLLMANDADMVLQAMYRVLPSKEIAALLRNL